MYAGSINRDHVHMLVGIPAQISVSRAVQYLKGKSSHRLLSEYKPLKKRYWGQRQWSRGYGVVKSGDVTDEVWEECMETQQPRGQMIIIRSQIYRGHIWTLPKDQEKIPASSKLIEEVVLLVLPCRH